MVPSIPRWLWILLLLGAVTATLGGGEPVLHLWSIDVEVGGLLKFLRITAVSIVLLATGALVSWTTNVADVAPAVATSRPAAAAAADPGRRLGRGAVAVAAGLPDAARRVPPALRGPQVTAAAGAARRQDAPPTLGRRIGRPAHRRVTVALRRADEMGDAITARGGTSQISAAPSRPKKADWVALGIIAVVGLAAFFVEIPPARPGAGPHLRRPALRGGVRGLLGRGQSLRDRPAPQEHLVRRTA